MSPETWARSPAPGRARAAHLSDDRPSYLLGLVGAGISASLTPAMHEREGRECGLQVSYRVIDTGGDLTADDLSSLLDRLQQQGFDGLNLTHPFKQAVLPLLDGLSTDATDLQAVNTVLLRQGARLGRNTDWSGFARAFRSALPDAVGDRVVVVGAGGAGVAVAYGLLDQGAAHVAVFDIDRTRAESCATRLGERFGQDRIVCVTDLAPALDEAEGLVNATPLGMVGHPGLPVPRGLVGPHLWVADVVYFPLETALIKLARDRGCRVVPGGAMAVYQAVGAFEHFTGTVADADRMSRHFAELTAAAGASR